MNKDGIEIPGTGPPNLAKAWASTRHCKHEQVSPRSEGQHDNVGGNCAICNEPLSKAFVKDVDGRLVYSEPVYVRPVGKSRKRGVTPL